MSKACVVPTIFLSFAFAAGLHGAEPKNGKGGGPGLSRMPLNTWVSLVPEARGAKSFSSIWYMPASDQFIHWGKAYGHVQPVYGVETFRSGDRSWRESFPRGKEEAWAGRKFPNWPVHGMRSRIRSWKGPHVNAMDRCVGGYSKVNSVSFVKAEGVVRPTRCPTFYQGCWNSKRQRMFYFVGGATFSYDPVKREWTNLKPASSPIACEHLVWASLCYDAHNDEVVLFGGGMATNPWGGARTWIYDCGKNTWRRPGFGTPEGSRLRAAVEEVRGRLRDIRCRLQYEEGQKAQARRAAVGVALKALKPLAASIKALPGRLTEAKQAGAARVAGETAAQLAALAAAPVSDRAAGLVWKLKELEKALEKVRRPLLVEPPLRCNSQLTYDPKNKVILLFGGNAQNATLNDTWIYDVRNRTWKERHPKACPPPATVVGTTYIDKHGLIFATGFRVPSRRPSYGAWVYDAAGNTWTPVKGSYQVAGRHIAWHSPAYSSRDDAVLLYASNHREATFAYRFAPATAAVKRKGHTFTGPRYRIDWDRQTRNLPAPDPEAFKKKIAGLPANKWVPMPGPHYHSKTWGSATVDTDKGVILYYGGGHSGYSGTDVAHYDIGAGRWSLSYPPEFPPFLEGTSHCPFGWGYNLHIWAEHTRKWYAYDPVSRMMVFASLGTNYKGRTVYVQGGDNKPLKATGYATRVYNPRLRKWYRPTFNQPFCMRWSGRTVTTPEGVFAHAGNTVWRATVEKSGSAGDPQYRVKWSRYGKTGGTGGEFDATVYDSKRHRLVILTGSGKKPTMTFFDIKTKKTTRPKPEGKWSHFRDACYIPDQDVIITPAAYKKAGFYVYRCAENKWIRPVMAMPGISRRRGGNTTMEPLKGSCPDTTMVYDPVHKVLFHFDRGSTVNLMRYDDKSVKFRAEGGSREN